MNMGYIRWMEEILHQFIGGLSHYFQAFYHPRWCIWYIRDLTDVFPGILRSYNGKNGIYPNLIWYMDVSENGV